MENNLNITIQPGNPMDESKQVVIHLLEGKSPDPVNKKPCVIVGNIHAVSAFVLTREFTLDKDCTHILFNEKEKSITLKANEQFENGITVIAKLEDYPELSAFGINQEKYFSLRDLDKHIRMNRYWFEDKDAHLKICTQLKGFSATINATIKEEQDNRSNRNSQRSKEVKTDLAADFKLVIPIFKGSQPSAFRVEICYDVTDSTARFWLESVELFELQKAEVMKAFDEHMIALTAKGFTIINA